MAANIKRLSQGLRVVFAAALLTVTSYSVAQGVSSEHPATYVVKRGDTLWDIAGRFLGRPWLWPEIWQANPQVKNPHLIYPGDVLSLAYLDRVGVQAGPRDEAPINAIPLSEIEKFLRDLRVVDSFEQLPYVVGLEDDRLRGSLQQVAYVKGISDQPGARYMVVRPTTRFSQTRRVSNGKYHQFTEDLDFRGRKMLTETADLDLGWTNMMLSSGSVEQLGFELLKVNVGTVTRGEVGDANASTLLLDDSGSEVRVGDRLIAVDAQPYDLQFFPHPPRAELPLGKAQIMALAEAGTWGGPRDVVAISAGAREGVDNGTVFSIWRRGSRVVDRVQYGDEIGDESVLKSKKVQLPDEFAGHVMVFRTFDRMSYGLVMTSIKPSKVGYDLKHPDATY